SIDTYAELVPYLNQDIAQVLVFAYNYDYDWTFDYLTGHWSDGDYYFDMYNNQSTLSDIPLVNPSSQYYDITEDGIYMHGDAKCFKFDIIDANTMDIYAYKNNQIYHMSRQ
ncbi:MAG: hypothetical protein RSC25_04830, partial [Christensenella sp.]